MAKTCEVTKPVAMVLLNEDKVSPRLGSEKSFKDVTWFFDTRASNHMSACRDIFTTLDMKITRSVKFGEGSIVEIKGCGNFLFKNKNEEHKVLTNKFYIPSVRSNIVSLGQLNGNGCKTILKDGTITIYDQQH